MNWAVLSHSHSLVRHVGLYRAPRGVVLQARPPLVAWPMYNPMGIRGYTPSHTHDITFKYTHVTCTQTTTYIHIRSSIVHHLANDPNNENVEFEASLRYSRYP